MVIFLLVRVQFINLLLKMGQIDQVLGALEEPERRPLVLGQRNDFLQLVILNPQTIPGDQDFPASGIRDIHRVDEEFPPIDVIHGLEDLVDQIGDILRIEVVPSAWEHHWLALLEAVANQVLKNVNEGALAHDPDRRHPLEHVHQPAELDYPESHGRVLLQFLRLFGPHFHHVHVRSDDEFVALQLHLLLQHFTLLDRETEHVYHLVHALHLLPISRNSARVV